jgi:hypothetical protein
MKKRNEVMENLVDTGDVYVIKKGRATWYGVPGTEVPAEAR